MLEVLRDHDSDAASEFRLLVQKQDGAWDVTFRLHLTMSSTSRGTGSTFQRRLGQHGATVDVSTTKGRQSPFKSIPLIVATGLATILRIS